MAQLPANLNEFYEERREASPSNFLMKIEGFSSLSKLFIRSYETRAFEAGGYTWKLMINFEDTLKKEEKNYVSVYFSVADCDSLALGWEVNAIFTFFLHNQFSDNYSSFRGKTRRFNDVNNKWGFSKLISLNRLKGYIVDDVCVFGAEVFVLNTQRVVECLSLVQNSAMVTRDWKIYGFSKLVDMWVSEEFAVADHKWRLQVYPKGNDSEAKGRFVSVYLECVSAKRFAQHQKIKAEVEISISDDVCSSHYIKFDHWFRSSMDHWGHNEFIPICEMRKYLNQDCCSLQVEVCVEAIVS